MNNCSQYYKRRYSIAFYDKTDENLIYVANNINEIVKWKNKENEKYARQMISNAIARALQTDTHFIRLSKEGETMRVHLIDMLED